MKHVTHTTTATGDVLRDEFEATCPDHARAQAIVKHSADPRRIVGVSAWPVRAPAEVVLDALSLRVGPTPIFDSSFGCLV